MKQQSRRKNRAVLPQTTPAQRAARTDLALEQRELWHREAGSAAALPGVRVSELQRRGIHTTVVHVLDETGARELQKPQGTYITLELSELNRRELRAFHRVTETLAGELAALMRLPPDAAVLVVGLGNEAVTPDALGPLVLRRLLVTRHLQAEPGVCTLRPVSALQPGVLGSTGMESFEIVRSVVRQTSPDVLIAVDALAARSLDRLCTTIQLSDAGITPGSGVGNSRAAFTRQSLGIPVYSIGTPTVADASGLLAAPAPAGTDLIVTPRSINARLQQIAGVIGCALNLSLQNHLTRGQIEQFVEGSR